ncbi:ABC transporter permease [Subtercola sp. YIM 133946]|uniref:ABC transporter permease n=1 Tax=Subtercola sp. YIM 133946 TaxID=3118909 RepID=UPI002F92B412
MTSNHLIETQPNRHTLPSLARAAVQRYSIVGIWILMAAIFAIAIPHLFLRGSTMQTIFGSEQPLIFLAMALVLIFFVGEFDISLPSILGLSATLVPVLNVNAHVPIGLSIVIALLATIAVGAVNAFVIVIVGADPFAVTLGMGTLLIGLCLWFTGSTTAGGLDISLSPIVDTQVLGLPISFYYSILLALILTYVLWRTPLGRHMSFIGANREVARLAGVRVNQIRFGAYVFAALIAGVGGVLLVLGVGGFDPSSSVSYLLPAFAAAILSTAIITPGRFNPIGALIAIFFLETGIIGLQLLGLAGWVTQFFFGAAVVVAVTVSTIVRRRVGRS